MEEGPFPWIAPDEPDAPSNAEKKAAEDADVAQQRWKNLMFNTHRSAQHAWDSGRTHHVLVTRLEYADGSPPDDVGGMLQVVTAIGWVLCNTDLASAVRTVIPGGVVGWGGFGVLGKDQHVSDLIAVYTFEKPSSLLSSPT